jgi:hypothetical protein
VAWYLVRARIRPDCMAELEARLEAKAFLEQRPFGPALTHALENARLEGPDAAAWEEEDYCTPPLAQEREAVLDEYFRDIRVESVRQGEGWRSIRSLPRLFPDLAAGTDSV